MRIHVVSCCVCRCLCHAQKVARHTLQASCTHRSSSQTFALQRSAGEPCFTAHRRFARHDVWRAGGSRSWAHAHFVAGHGYTLQVDNRNRPPLLDRHPPPHHTRNVCDPASPFHLSFSSSSAPDATRDFARIGDFLKSSMSSNSAQGGGVDKAASGRPQTQAGGYKVVAPWER